MHGGRESGASSDSDGRRVGSGGGGGGGGGSSSGDADGNNVGALCLTCLKTLLSVQLLPASPIPSPL